MKSKNLIKLMELIKASQRLEYLLHNEECFVLDKDKNGNWNKTILAGSIR